MNEIHGRSRRNEKQAEGRFISRNFSRSACRRRDSERGPACQSYRQGRVQICGRQDDFGELFQPTQARSQNFRRPGSLWRGLARGGGRRDVLCPECGCGRGRQERARGQIHVVHAARAYKWTLILSKKIGEWGIPYPGEKFDFARMEMKVSRLPSPLENFTISFDQAGTSCTMKLDWETTRASIDIAEKK